MLFASTCTIVLFISPILGLVIFCTLIFSGFAAMIFFISIPYKQIQQINTNYPHALKKYCKKQNIPHQCNIADYNLKIAFKISQIKNEVWEELEKEELAAIDAEYGEILTKYPHGLNVAISKYETLDKEFLLEQRSFIVRQQGLFDDETLFIEWEKEHQAFTKDFGKFLSSYRRFRQYICYVGLNMKDRHEVISDGQYDVVFASPHETSSRNDIDLSDVPLEWELLRDNVLNNSYKDDIFDEDDDIIDLIRLIDKEFIYNTTFVIGNLDQNTIPDLGKIDSHTKYSNLIANLQAEGIDVITMDYLFSMDELKHTKIIIVSKVIIESQLRGIIKVLQNCRKREKLCICCISKIIDHDTSFANRLLTEYRKRVQALNAIHNFHQAYDEKSVDDIQKHYKAAVELIETDKKLSALLPSLKIIKNKYSEFEREYTEGIILAENINTVKYFTPIEYQYIDTSRYYYIVFPKEETKIFPYRRRKVNRRGYSEEHFEKTLLKYLLNTSIISDAALFISEDRQFEPDIALIYENNYHINIDIEIDEPYSGYDRKPIHCKDNPADLYRDQIFINAGWIVIRFAEEQVIKSPLNCTLIVARLLHAIDNMYTINKSILADIEKSGETFYTISKWNKDEAMNMAATNYREQYLNISSFGKVENQERSSSECKLTPSEEKLSNEFPSIEICPEHYIIDEVKTQNTSTHILSSKRTKTEKDFVLDLSMPSPKPGRTNPEIIVIDRVKQVPNIVSGFLSISQIMRHYFRSINHSYIASIKSHGDTKIENSILTSLEIEDARREFIYDQIYNIIHNTEVKTTFDIRYNGKTYCDIDLSRELSLIQQFIASKGTIPQMAGTEITDQTYMLKAKIGCIYKDELYDFDIFTEYHGAARGKSILAHIGDVPNERNDIIVSIKAYLVEQHLGIKINKTHTVTIDAKHNEYHVRRARRRTSEVQRILQDLIHTPIDQYDKL